eukprot:TRINITY_DN4928_c0_g4_i2.p1 TRINITY_DN4928_c0_g4~~TRINITY_DN4928_c0_g4_i2.p1  ORF type:complete len:108 (-),score=11.45 TRINITY_DN4928_c0_g4_i2:770-1093(-)
MTFIPYSPPSAGRSFVAASLFFSLTAALLILNAKLLASSKGLTIVAGFVGSLLFDFALIAISSLIACLASNHESGWAEGKSTHLLSWIVSIVLCDMSIRTNDCISLL